MTNLKSATDFYHELALSGSMAQDSWEIMAPGMKERHLYFGDRPLCTVLRPLFHSEESYRWLAERTALTLSVFKKATEAMLADARLRRMVGLTPEEEVLVQLPTGYNTNIPTARLDSFFTRHGAGRYTLNYIEFNGESPAGMAYNDVLAQLFLETPLMRKFQERYKVKPLDVRGHAQDALVRIFQQWSGNKAKLPDIAIVDFKGVPTTTEFILFQKFFAESGIETTICDPEDMDFHKGKLYAAGRHVDFVWKRILTTELLQKYGLDHPLIEAAKARAVCIANPFNCKLLHKKASFAVVSDERNARLFTQNELEVIRQHIPWTRIIEDRETIDAQGRPIDLLSWSSKHRDHLVLKPNDEYGGKGVLIGWETDQSTWDKALQNALTEMSIVQERAVIAYEDFPSIDDNGNVTISERLVDCDPYLFHGDTMGGTLVRLSTVTLLNVTAGGGSVIPAFMIKES
jgi:hypothetical protein